MTAAWQTCSGKESCSAWLCSYRLYQLHRGRDTLLKDDCRRRSGILLKDDCRERLTKRKKRAKEKPTITGTIAHSKRNSLARASTCVRLLTLSLLKICLTCDLTVLNAMTIWSAIS